MVANWKLYLDDIRAPTSKGWTIVKTVENAIQLIDLKGIPLEMSLDHDLGDGMTGYDFVRWLAIYTADNGVSFSDIKFNVHSANIIGKYNMERFIEYVKNLNY